MLRLLLMRHAKSSWDEASLSDIDRPLSDRGERAAVDMAKAMTDRGLIPDRVLCSPARRTRETWARVSASLDAEPEVTVLDGLYEAQPGDYIRLIAEHGGNVGTVMLIGHNPTIHGTAIALGGDSERRYTADIAFKYPTGALAVIDFDADNWAELSPGTGRIVDFIKPRDLEQAG